MIDKFEQNRIREELIRAGVTKHNLHKDEVKHLFSIVHPDEHIMAAINGRADLGSVMIVATDRRIFYLDCKPFYTTVDELTYDIVSGVMHHIQGIYAQVTMHTRAGDYSLRFVKPKQAELFVEYLEAKRLVNQNDQVAHSVNQSPVAEELSQTKKIALGKPATEFLQTHTLAVLSTSDRTSNVYGAVVNYIVDNLNQIFIVSKSETAKATNALAHRQVALTVFDEFELATLQIQGVASYINDRQTADRVIKQMLKPRQFGDTIAAPPVTKLDRGAFMVLGIFITDAKFSKFK